MLNKYCKTRKGSTVLQKAEECLKAMSASNQVAYYCSALLFKLHCFIIHEDHEGKNIVITAVKDTYNLGCEN